MSNADANYHIRARFYDLEFNDASDQNLLRSRVTSATRRILEIPCGSGRNCEWLAQTGKDIVFGDLSPEMTEVVARKLNKLPFPHVAKAEQADMLTYQPPVPFDLILVPREGLQMLDHRRVLDALKNLKNNLSKTGLLYVDLAVLNPALVRDVDKLPKYISEQGDEYILDLDVDTGNRTFVRWHKSQLDGENLRIQFLYKVSEQGEPQEYSSAVTLAAYDRECFELLCKRAGLSILNIYGGYDGKSHTPDSERMIFVLKNFHE